MHLKDENREVLALIASLGSTCDALTISEERSLAEVLQSPFFLKVRESFDRPSLREGKLRVCAATCNAECSPFKLQYAKTTPAGRPGPGPDEKPPPEITTGVVLEILPATNKDPH